jgi:hypothetical protein
MSFIVRRTQGDFNTAPEGLHNAVCVDMVDLGVKKTPWGDKHKCRLWWQLEVRDDEGRRHTVFKDYTVSLDQKANLTKDLEAWRGRQFTEQELDGFDVETVIGAPCQLQVSHNLGSNGNTYANVMTVVPVGKGMTKIRPEDWTRIQDREAAPTNGRTTVNPPPPDESFEASMEDVPF